jgi:uncharacterized membrane protein YkvA (DUF1232 family)
LGLVEGWRARARVVKRDTLTLYLACRHPRTPWYAKALAGVVVAYAFSPIDLIPDFVPVLGYLDDLLLIPAGIALAVKLIPAAVIAECREQASEMAVRPVSRVAAAVIGAIWIGAAFLCLRAALELFGLL